MSEQERKQTQPPRKVKYEVKVLANGFEWNGCVFGSLSAVARAITGVNRNGFLSPAK